MSDQLAVEHQGLAKKDKQELRTIVEAMGGKVSSRASKAGLVDEIINLSRKALSEQIVDVSEPVEEVEVSTSDDVVSTPKKIEKNTKVKEEPEEPQPANSKNGKSSHAKDDSANARRQRRRGRKNQDREEAGNDAVSDKPEPVEGFLDLRDEGYGFLRVKGFLPSKEDVYVSVKQVRQLGLRKGDHLAGLSTPAHRNEKNPCFHQIDTVNGSLAEGGADRPLFDDLTPLLPTEPILLEPADGGGSLSNRMIDLFAPLAKGQRAFVVSPPKAGKTTLIKELSDSIQSNHPDINLLVLAIDGRPEEITDMYNHLKNGEIVASNFDSPADEHIAVAELTLERAKRLAETGEDVFIIVDNLSQLARAYMTTHAQSNRSAAIGLDLTALYPIKKFLGAAINLEGSGSLTILSTVSYPENESEPGVDKTFYSEIKFTANMEIRLDGRMAQQRIFPAIDLRNSSISHEQNLRSSGIIDSVHVVKDWVADQNVADSFDRKKELLEKLKNSASNEDFLNEIVKKGSL